MLNNATVMDRYDIVDRARQEAPTRPSESQQGRLRAMVEMHAISLTLRPNTWIWDVQKRRAVTVAYLVGQHASRGPERLQRCTECAAIAEALLDLVTRAVPPQENGCRHMIGTTRAEHAGDNLAERVHQVSLPVVFIHPTVPFKDDLCSLKCATEFRSHLQRFGVRERVATEIGDRS